VHHFPEIQQFCDTCLTLQKRAFLDYRFAIGPIDFPTEAPFRFPLPDLKI